MVLEIAQFDIKPGQEAAFRTAFAQAIPLIRGAKGCRGLDLRQGLETPGRFTLLVQWDSLDDHVKGFAESAAGAQAGGLLAGFFAGAPQVAHSQSVLTA